MKKLNTHNKLQLKLETVKALPDRDLKEVLGGANPQIVQPTTTVQRTFIC
ncbi:MAG TPA: hypothetical protein VFP84_30245 [Kofleriaceae bacterium]|nr:hypothetical protein [Kofleriaceae bacterium]